MKRSKSSQLPNSHQIHKDLSIAELNQTSLHLVDNRQALQVVSGRPELVAATLKAFFDDNADARNLGACLAADVQQATLSFTGR